MPCYQGHECIKFIANIDLAFSQVENRYQFFMCGTELLPVAMRFSALRFAGKGKIGKFL